MDFQILIPPFIGGLIGYLTNDIAIKMLFHPRKPLYIGKWQVPFTPGLIPKEKHRVAKSIGIVASTQLLDANTLLKVFTSEESLQKLRTSLEHIVEANKENEDTVEEIFKRWFPNEMTESHISENIEEDLVSLLKNKLTELQIGETISKYVLYKANDKLKTIPFGFMANLFDETLINSIAKNVGEIIQKTIDENSEELIQNLIETELDKLKKAKLCDIIEKYEEKIPNMIDFIVHTYVVIIKNNLEQICNEIHLEKVIEEKINSFDAIQLEQMIFGIMKKELNAIVYLGAILGFFMGWINVFI